MDRLEPVHHTVDDQKEIPPGDRLLAPLKMHSRTVAAAEEEFVDVHLFRNFLERLSRVQDRERNQDGARPGGNLVDVEPEPVGKQDDLRRNGRNGVVVVLPEEAEIDFGEGVDLGDPAHFENLLACAGKGWVIRFVAGELQTKVGFHRSANVRLAALVDWPATIFVLAAKDVICSFLESRFSLLSEPVNSSF